MFNKSEVKYGLHNNFWRFSFLYRMFLYTPLSEESANIIINAIGKHLNNISAGLVAEADKSEE